MLAKEKEILDSYSQLNSISKTAEQCGVTRYRVRKIRKKYGVVGVNRVYNINYNFFKEIDNKNKAYWLGFLYADGCISVSNGKKKAYRLCVDLAEKDGEHLERFKVDVESSHPIKTVVRELNGKKYVSKLLRIASKEFVEFLIDNGCNERKTLNLSFPSFLERELIPHFIRGYFDGDGTITCNINNWNSFEFSLIGTLELLTEVQKILMKDLGFSETKILTKGKAYTLKYGGNNNMRKLRKWLYNNSEGLYLKRKKEKWDELKEKKPTLAE